MADPTRPEGIEFVSDEEERYFQTAQLGIEAQAFLQSEIGRYLWERAREEYATAVEEMFKLNPYTPEGKLAHAEIKQRAWCSENFMQWCIEAINSGRNAEAQMRHLRQGD